MLRNKKYLIWLSITLLFASCAKNLDQQPQSTANKDVIFSSADGLQLYANSFYDVLPGINDVFRTDANMSDYGARNAVPDYIRAGFYNSRQSSGWSWTALRNINYFIANNTNAKIAQSVRDNYTGLARFFRAYFYYNMVQKFGDVPWISKPLSVTDTALLYGKRDPREKVMDSVLADLNYAIGHMSLSTDASRSQITKWVAYGMKSRICLFEGTYRKYDSATSSDATVKATANQWLQEAATSARAVMDSAGFSLNTSNGLDLSYRNLFISTSPVTNEIMLSSVTSSSLAVLNDANWYYTSSTYGVRLNFTRDFINMYLNLDGSAFTDIPGHDTLTFWQETQGRDKRLAQTIRTPGYTRISSGSVIAGPPAFNYSYTGYQPIKWCLDDTYYDNGTLNTNSISQMRYAEILLNYAEAQQELGQLSPSDWTKTIGALRSRAGITGGLNALPAVADPYIQAYFQRWNGGLTDPVLLEIYRERSIELVLEGLRYSDLLRWGMGKLLLRPWNGFYVPALNQLMDLDQNGTPDVCFYQGTKPGNVTGVTYINVATTIGSTVNPQTLEHGTYGNILWLVNGNPGAVWNEWRAIYPIPYNDLQLNANLGQNPGWN
ncbi:MAG: RagB/SusD family nutrient uptake outer membrane protein [Sphingobacteriales bacterium 50-39]|nr:RagB/SusD family nutrient uptake outer membrane protein [Sphingobacteriales bacterium]OJW58540.1 MAG: RagB/SusD family nutrient uptake outer membrane protein [Sphingobacteriales bacterium 50-39]